MLAWLGTAVGYLAPFVLVLSVLVFFHELGHYLAARINGVRVETFSIGFGPEIWGWTDRSKTRWKVSWLPLGGYVKMWGDETVASTPDNEKLSQMSEEERCQTLQSKTVWQRMAISAAGPFANYLLAFVLFSGLFIIEGYRYTAPVVGVVLQGSVAEKAGFQPRDRIVEMNGQPVQRFEDVVQHTRERSGQKIRFLVQRGPRTFFLEATPTPPRPKFSGGMLGIQASGDVLFEPKGFFQALGCALREIGHISWYTIEGIWEMVRGKRSSEGMGGPLMIAQLSGEIVHLGVAALIWFTALLSLNLGLINLFPVPLLDGGHLFLYGLEAIRGKPLSEKYLEWCYRFGLGLVLGLMVLTTWNDLKRLQVIQWMMQFWS